MFQYFINHLKLVLYIKNTSDIFFKFNFIKRSDVKF